MKKLILIFIVSCFCFAAYPQIPSIGYYQPTYTETLASNGLLEGLVSVWELDETSGTTAFDSHGSNNLTNNGTASINQTGLTNLTPCYDFDGTNDYLSRTNTSSLNPADGEMSWSFWMHYDSYSTQPDIISDRPLGALGTEAGYVIGYSGYGAVDERFIFQIDGGNSDAYSIRLTSNAFTLNVWNHFVVTWDGSTATAKIYRGGSDVTSLYEVDTNTWNTSTSTAANTNDFIISGRPGTTQRRVNGSIDQVAIWGRVLTATEVDTLYDLGNGLPYSNFTAQIEQSIKTLWNSFYENIEEIQTLKIAS